MKLDAHKIGGALPLLALLLSIPGIVQAQFMTSPDFKRLFPKGNTYKMSWWEMEGGGVYNVPTSGTQRKQLIEAEDTTYSVRFDPSGGFSYSARLGRYHVTPKLRFFKYIDYSLGYRRIVGREDYDAELSTLYQNGSREWSGKGDFDISFLMLNLNLNNVLQLSDHGFLQNSLGLNAEYQLGGRAGYDGQAHRMDPEQAPEFMGQLHYRLGYGMRVTEKFFLVPSLETAILNLYPFDVNSTLPLLNSRYRSISLSIKFLFLKRHRPTGY